MAKLGVIMSVGTSLRVHFLTWLKKSEKTVPDVDGELRCCGPHFRDFVRELIADWKNTDARRAYPAAELQTLGIYLADRDDLRAQDKHITLYYARTEDRKGESCARALQWWLEYPDAALPVLGRHARVSTEPFDLEMNDEHAFGIHMADLVTRIRSQSEDYRNNGYTRVLAAITGGYKVLSPFLSLLGFIDGLEVLYGYEASTSVLIIPQLPLSWDLRFLDEFRSCIAMDEVPREMFQALPAKMRQFYLPNADGTLYRVSPFGRMLARDYTDRRHVRFGYGEPLLSRIQRPDLRDKIRSLIECEWEYLWLGDQIPETVEHSRGHSARLMEMARDLLDHTGLELADHELFALVAAIWLHDIGHSALVADQIRLGDQPFPLMHYPSLVRELHHVLSSERILNDRRLPQDGLPEDGLANDTRGVVALMSLYHRRKMPLYDGSWAHEIFCLTEPPLWQKVADMGELSIEGIGLDPGRLMLITALLRLLDACDVQADRVVNPHYVKARRLRTAEEVEVYLTRLAQVVEGAESEGSARAEKLRVVFCRVSVLAKDWSAKDGSKLRQEIVKDALAASDSKACPADLVALGLADAILFKLEQEAHFVLHGAIKFVHIAAGRNGNVNVHLLAPDASARASVSETAAGIWREYEAARRPLDGLFELESICWNHGAGIETVMPTPQ